jgi:hypothetical protein
METWRGHLCLLATRSTQVRPYLTTGAAEWLTWSSDKVTPPSLPVANKETHRLIPVVRTPRGACLVADDTTAPLTNRHNTLRAGSDSIANRKPRRTVTIGSVISGVLPGRTQEVARAAGPTSEGESISGFAVRCTGAKCHG